MRRFVLFVLSICVCSGLRAASADEVRTVRIRFDPGASNTSIRDRIKGHQSVNYELGAGGGARTLHFTDGKATSSDGAGAVTMERAGDLNKVSVGAGERFEIPDVVIVGD